MSIVMTDEQKYNVVLKELGELLQHKNTTISCQRFHIDNLKAKLQAAEKERSENSDAAQIVLDREAIDALRSINAALQDFCKDIENTVDVAKLKTAQSYIAALLPVNGGAA